MTQPLETWVSQERVDAESWEALSSKMMASARWRDDASVFVYVESLDNCELERCAAGSVLDSVRECARSELTNLLEGRIFDSSVEARWRRLAAGKWAAWIVRELPKAPEAANDSTSDWSRPARRTIRRYYLLGKRGQTANNFHEARYAKRFKYPVQGACPNDRAYVEVAEYRRVEPEWSDFAATDDGIKTINHKLSEPLLFAHRFVSVGAGTGRKEG